MNKQVRVLSVLVALTIIISGCVYSPDEFDAKYQGLPEKGWDFGMAETLAALVVVFCILGLVINLLASTEERRRK